MRANTIKQLIDKHLQKAVDWKVNTLPGYVEQEMADVDQDESEEWRVWYPIDSALNYDDLSTLESAIGYPLPTDYKTFLQHKHFYELHISEVTFSSFPVNTWKETLLKPIYKGYPKEYLIEKGLIAFADWGDWGYCVLIRIKMPATITIQ